MLSRVRTNCRKVLHPRCVKIVKLCLLFDGLQGYNIQAEDLSGCAAIC